MRRITVILFITSLLLLSACAVNPEQTSTPKDIAGTYVGVHLEVNSLPGVRNNWAALEETVDLADRYNIKLTLMFTPQWVDAALEDPALLEQVRAWEANGHELAAHHHSVDHQSWDGYTNDDSYKDHEDYRGDMQEFLEYVEQISADGKMTTGGIMDADVDWTPGLLYQTTNSGSGTGLGQGAVKEELLSTPIQQTYLGDTVTEVTKSAFEIDHVGDPATLPYVQSRLATANEDEILGLVINDDTILNSQDKIERLFQYFAEHNIEVLGVTEILENY